MKTKTSVVTSGILLALVCAPACAQTVEEAMEQVAVEIELQTYEIANRLEELQREIEDLRPRAPRLPTHYTPPFAGQKLYPHPNPCVPGRFIYLPAGWGAPRPPSGRCDTTPQPVTSQGE